MIELTHTHTHAGGKGMAVGVANRIATSYLLRKIDPVECKKNCCGNLASVGNEVNRTVLVGDVYLYLSKER